MDTTKDTEEPLALTVEDVARLLQLAPESVYRRVRDGSMPSVRVGRAIRIPRAALTELLTNFRASEP